MEYSEFFKSIMSIMPTASLLVDKSRTIKDCNDGVKNVFGYTCEEIVGKKTELLYGDRRVNKSDRAELYNRLARDGYHIGSARGTRKDGRNMPLDLYTFIIKEDSGALVLIKEAQKLPAEIDTARLLQDLLDTIPDMIYFKDTKNRFIMVNKAHADALGLRFEEIIGKTDLDLFPKELADRYFADDNIILRTGKPVLDKIESAPRPDGGITYVSTTKVPRFDKDGSIVGTIGITRNVTERVTAEEELRVYKERLEELVKDRTRQLEEQREKLLRMYNLKSEFTSMVSHELRTPLAVIKDGVSVVSEGSAGELNDQQKNFLGMALANIDRLSRLINDVLDLSKLETKKMEFRIVKGNLNELIDDVLKSYEHILKKKGLRLHKKLDPFLPLVRLDPDRITQVFYNLMTNAVKFTDEGFIGVESKTLKGRVTISVEDTGQGMRKEDLYRIFEKFEQIAPADRAKAPGTGLGLAICKQIIEQLGGRIWVESEFGKGSKFFFSLPIKELI